MGEGHGDDDSLESRANDFSGFDNSTTTTVNDGNRTTKTTRASESSSSTTANNGHITDSVGSKAKVSIEVKDNIFVDGKKVTDTSVYETSHDQTFTSAGSDPGDKQTLKINSSSTYTDGRKTEYDTPRHFTYLDSTLYILPYDSVTDTLSRGNSSSYNASHSLGSDGISSVGGTLHATNSSTNSVEKEYGGVSLDQTITEGTITEITNELTEHSTSSGLRRTLEENGTYGEGQAYRGRAKSTNTYWTRESIESTHHGQKQVGEFDRDTMFVSETNDTHTVTWQFKAGSSTINTENESSKTTEDVWKSREDFEDFDGSIESGRHNTKSTSIDRDGVSESSELVQSREWGYVANNPYLNRDPEYDETTVSKDIKGPGTGAISATGGPANPGSIEVGAGVSSVAEDESLGEMVDRWALEQAIEDSHHAMSASGIDDLDIPLTSPSLQEQLFPPQPLTAIVVDPVELEVNRMLYGPGPSNLDMGLDAIAMVTGLKAAKGVYQISKVVGREILDSALDKATDGAYATLRFAKSLFSRPATVTIAVTDDAPKITPQQRGRLKEGEVLDDLGIPKNSGKVSTPEGNSIPDGLTDDLSVEVKDTKVVSRTKQIRIQTDAAREAGRKSILITGENTKITGPAKEAFDEVMERADLGPQ